MRQNNTMYLSKFWLCLVMGLCSFTASTQTLQGTITDEKNEPLVGASVVLQGTSKETLTDRA